MTRQSIPSVAFFQATNVSRIMESPNGLSSTLFVKNLHCSSCVLHANDTVKPLRGIYSVDVNLAAHTICIHHSPALTTKEIAETLINAAFEVSHVTTQDTSGTVLDTYDAQQRVEQVKSRFFSIFMDSARRQHIANCSACREQIRSERSLLQPWAKFLGKWNRSPTNIKSDIEHGQVDVLKEKSTTARSSERPEAFVATIAVGGMTCPACANTIRDQLCEVDIVKDVTVSLQTNSASIKYEGATNDAAKLVETVEDTGFDATLISVEPVLKDIYKATFTIRGMTCGSCVGTVTRGLETIEGITSVNVNLQNNCAVVEMIQRDITEKVLSTIDDLGFEGTLVEIRDVHQFADAGASHRTVVFDVFNMYCEMCPPRVVSKIKEEFGTSVDILAEPTLKKPQITLSYRPSPSGLNIRTLKATIEQADPQLKASPHHEKSVEERSKALQERELRRILWRLLSVLILWSAPSFVIGICFMSLVSDDNKIRRRLERPLVGNSMLMDWLMLIFSTPVMFYGADIFWRRALKEIWALWRPKSKVPILRRFIRFGSMNTLIGAGTAVAYFSSVAILIMDSTSPAQHDAMHSRRSITYFDTVTFLTLFILMGKFLQARSKAKTGESVAALSNLRATTAQLVIKSESESRLTQIPVSLLELGDIVSVAHGSSPPTDGIVDEESTCLFDESSMTGESKPVRKAKGDKLYQGSINRSDPVKMMVTELGGKSMLDQIIAVVRTGQGKRAPVEGFADLATGYFAPIITFLAIFVWLLWLVLGETGSLPQSWLDVNNGGWAFWSLEFAIAVFVVACPCGLGLAAPTALSVGGGLAAKAGILVQGGGEAFEAASKIDAIVLDKTGTLTEGQMQVTGFESLANTNELEQLMLRMAASLEEASTHPIAKAILTFCNDKMPSELGLSVNMIEVKEEPGLGMKGVFTVSIRGRDEIQKYEAILGNEKQLSSHSGGKMASKTTLVNQTHDGSFLSERNSLYHAAGCSTAVLSLRSVPSDGRDTTGSYKPSAIFAIADPIRQEAIEVLSALRSCGVQVHMCTGDNVATARAIGSQLDIPVSHIRAGVLPQDKADYISELQQPDSDSKRRVVAFVGDGTNDAPALTAADVSIAMASGSDIAAKSASFILLNSNLATILTLVRLSKRVFRRVLMNFIWAAAYNVILIPVAAGIPFAIWQWRLNPAWAALAMALSSISVVLSSLALKVVPEICLRKSVPFFEFRKL